MLARLVEERTREEMEAGAKALRYDEGAVASYIARQSSAAARYVLSDIRYNATNPEYGTEDPEHFLLQWHIEEELLKRYSKGVLCLAGRANCPLMWSHYGDQHRGLCLGYSIPDDVEGQVHKVTYRGSRLVHASQVSAMLEGDDAARRAVDQAVLLRKARPWAYEREWRVLGPRGQHDSPLELEEVVFGMRCPSAVIFTVVHALGGRDRPVRFFEIREQPESFGLDKRSADIDELLAMLPRRSRQICEAFAEVELTDAP